MPQGIILDERLNQVLNVQFIFGSFEYSAHMGKYQTDNYCLASKGGFQKLLSGFFR